MKTVLMLSPFITLLLGYMTACIDSPSNRLAYGYLCPAWPSLKISGAFLPLFRHFLVHIPASWQGKSWR